MEKNQRKKILVLGAGGLLGSEVVRFFSKESFDVKATTHAELDITKGREVAIWLERLHPDVIINCAAVSNVDACEGNKEFVFNVNAEGVKNLCLPLLEDVGAKLIHISTDYVFDGTKTTPYVETDSVNPLSVYAESKLKGEVYVQRILPPRALILRVQWLYGPKGKSFASSIIQDITEGRYPKKYRFIKDRVGNPTSVTFLAKAIEVAIEKDLEGIYHLSSTGSASWVDFGKAIFEMSSPSILSDDIIEAVKESDIKRPAKRPSYTPFSCKKFEIATGFSVTSWRDQLLETIHTLTVP